MTVDGRTARSERTRAAIVGAAIALVEDGQPSPTARDIAERAGVSERTFFLHFADLEELRAAIADAHVDAVARRHVRIDAAVPFDERVRRFAARRGRVLEDMTALRRAALLHESTSPALQRSRRRWGELARAELERTFAAELAAVDDRAATVPALVAATGWAAWDDLRVAQGLSQRSATSAMELTVRRLLKGE